MKRLRNLKQEQFCNKLVSGETGFSAYKDSYPKCKTDNSARVNASRLLDNPKIQSRIGQLLEAQGITLTNLNSALKELISANKEILIRNKKGDYEVKEVRENPIRLEATKLAYRLHGVLTETQSYQDNRAINLNLSPEQLIKLETIVKSIHMLNISLKTSAIQSGEDL